MKKLFPSVELLESRIAPAVFTVTSNAATGTGSITQALQSAAGTMETDTINFNLPLGATIVLSAELLITTPVILEGRSNPGYADSPVVKFEALSGSITNGLVFGMGSDGSQVHAVEIAKFGASGLVVNAGNVTVTGSTFSSNSTGIQIGGADTIIGGPGVTGRNVITSSATVGLFAEFASGLSIQNTYVGVDRSGLVAEGNGGAGIFLRNCTSPTVGGTEKNVIAGNALEGIHLVDCFNEVLVQNNYVGIFANGTFSPASANGGVGILAVGGANHLIGRNDVVGATNYIANNAGGGLLLDTTTSMQAGTATVTGNFIGSSPQGMMSVPASNGPGAIRATGPGIRIGGVNTESNVILWDSGDGIISTDGLTGVRGNFIVQGGGLVIDIFDDARTVNDSPDADGAVNFPVLNGAFKDGMGNYFVSGSIRSTPNTELRVELFGYSVPALSRVTDFAVTTDAFGFAEFLQSVPSLDFATSVAATAAETFSGRTSEMSDFALVAPVILFSAPGTVTQAEGNAGATLVSFDVVMPVAPIGAVSVQLSAGGATTAVQGADFTFSPSTLNFNAMTTTQQVTIAITGDTAVEPLELIQFVLGGLSGNAVLVGSTKFVEIANDDTSLKISADGKTATWQDVDGDLATLKATKGLLDAADFTMEAQGLLGGEALLSLNLSDDGAPAKGVGLTISAKYDKTGNRGDGAVNVGFINAATLDLGIVRMDGDLARIDAGDTTLTDGSIKSLTIGSMGIADGGGRTSLLQGKVGALTVRGDISNSRLVNETSMAGNAAAGSFGAILIGGSLRGDNGGIASIFASGDIGSVKIGGSIISDTSVPVSGLRAMGKMGAVTIGGSLRGTRPDAVASIEAGTTLGKVTIGGDMEYSYIFSLGKALPANAAAAVAIAGISVKGRVSDSLIGAGQSSEGAQNPDAQIGALTVGGDWIRSSAFAGSGRGADLRYGTADDAVFTPSSGFANNPAILSKIASVTVKGQIYGTASGPMVQGFVAEAIGKFVRGPVAYKLTAASLPLDVISLSAVGNVFVREVA